MTFLVKFLYALLLIFLTAGFISILAIAALIRDAGNPPLGQVIRFSALGMLVILGCGWAFVAYKRRPGIKQHEYAAQAPVRVLSAHESETYEHDAETVWALIRPAETAVLLGNAQRAFVVPGTPTGVGEQQCFIDESGSTSIIEVIGEEPPRWCTTTVVMPGEVNERTTYRLEPAGTGCRLTIGITRESRASAESLTAYEASWRLGMRQYLTRVKHALALQQNS